MVLVCTVASILCFWSQWTFILDTNLLFNEHRTIFEHKKCLWCVCRHSLFNQRGAKASANVDYLRMPDIGLINWSLSRTQLQSLFTSVEASVYISGKPIVVCLLMSVGSVVISVVWVLSRLRRPQHHLQYIACSITQLQQPVRRGFRHGAFTWPCPLPGLLLSGPHLLEKVTGFSTTHS